jgi:hypothetical protein
MDLQICYKGYVLKVEIIRITGYKDKFRLKGLCREVGFEFVCEMDENALDRLKDRFREQVDYYLEEYNKFIEDNLLDREEKNKEKEIARLGWENYLTKVGVKDLNNQEEVDNKINEIKMKAIEKIKGS